MYSSIQGGTAVLFSFSGRSLSFYICSRVVVFYTLQRRVTQIHSDTPYTHVDLPLGGGHWRGVHATLPCPHGETDTTM